MEEMIGRVDALDVQEAVTHWKARGVDLSQILYDPPLPDDAPRRQVVPQDHGLERTLDTALIEACRRALEHAEPVDLALEIRNVHRTVGTRLGYEVTRRYGGAGLPDDTIRLHFRGSAGQSFGAFVPSGIRLTLEGDSNDYLGKGLSGGRLIVYPPREARFKAEENIITGNVALYGATSGEAFIRGVAGERFAVRNSGAVAVVEGIGDHGCEYMTGGRVIVLGRTGRNFAAGMSGGIAYVLDGIGMLASRCNRGLVELEALAAEDEEFLQRIIERHVEFTSSALGARVLHNWGAARQQFVKVMPRDYKRVLQAEARAAAEGRMADFAELVGAANG
jgi:glutamate synthase domain-containing protein 3